MSSFPGDSAPGPSGLRANHLKEALRCPSPDCAVHATCALTGVVKLLCGGRAPHDVIPHLCGASLLPCNKKGGGLRPIAVGEVLRRLTSKCISRSVQSEALQVLTPLQVGVGVKGGCEAVVHSVSRTLEDPNIPSLNVGPSYLIFPTPLIASTGTACFKKSEPASHPWLPGWRAAMVSSPSFTLVHIPS